MSDPETILKEMQGAIAAYDGTVPFPEFAERYFTDFPPSFDYRVWAKCIVPRNAPTDTKIRRIPFTVEIDLGSVENDILSMAADAHIRRIAAEEMSKYLPGITKRLVDEALERL